MQLNKKTSNKLPSPPKKNHTHTNKWKGSNNFCPLCFFHITKESICVINTWISLVHFFHHINVGFDWWTYSQGSWWGWPFIQSLQKCFCNVPFTGSTSHLGSHLNQSMHLRFGVCSHFPLFYYYHIWSLKQILYFIYGCTGSSLLWWAFSSCGKWMGLPFYKCTGFSFFRTQALEHRL